jgi:hypothetical protein
MKDTPMSPERYAELVRIAAQFSLEPLEGNPFRFLFKAPSSVYSFVIDLSATEPEPYAIMLTIVQKIKKESYEQGKEDYRNSILSLLGLVE